MRECKVNEEIVLDNENIKIGDPFRVGLKQN